MEPDSVDMNVVRDTIVDGSFNRRWEICDIIYFIFLHVMSCA
jgi:hypothetical protein